MITERDRHRSTYWCIEYLCDVNPICFVYWLFFWIVFQLIWCNVLILSGVDAYFRKTGLERSECLAKDLEWFSQEGNVIPAPSNPGVSYAQYLEELAETSPPLFLSHFYNIYFSHIAGGQVIAKKVRCCWFIQFIQ